MKVIALEEHFITDAIADAWKQESGDVRDLDLEKATQDQRQRLQIGDTAERLAYMDAAGIDVQVLSVTTTAVEHLDPAKAIPLARVANNLIAETIRSHPDRFDGFATLPMADPTAAATELERAVVDLGLKGAMIFGRQDDRNLDHADFLPVLQTANDLRAALYLHPQPPPDAVRRAYYDDFPHGLATALRTAGIGWHYETGIQALRLILSGVFDRLPDLQLILGHWGEVVLFYLERIDLVTPSAGLSRPVSDYFREQISVTPSGMLSQRYLRWALEVLGADRILFATDYPFELLGDEAAPNFLQAADIGDADRDRIASGNWERMTHGIRRPPAA